MIDWAIIISTAVGFMVASVTKVGEGFAQKVGEELYEVVKKKVKNDKQGQRILSDFEKKPDWYQTALIGFLKEKAESDKSFGNEIKSIVEKNTQSQDNARITQNATGTGNAQAAGNNATATTNVTIKD